MYLFIKDKTIFFMKIPAVKINTITPKAANPKQIQKATPVKDALIVSGFCALPIVFYEGACFVAKKLNKGNQSDFFEYQ